MPHKVLLTLPVFRGLAEAEVCHQTGGPQVFVAIRMVGAERASCIAMCSDDAVSADEDGYGVWFGHFHLRLTRKESRDVMRAVRAAIRDQRGVQS